VKRPSRPGITLLTLLILLGVLVVLGATFLFVSGRLREGEYRHCQENLKLLALAAISYADDYDGPLPSASLWQEVLRSYINIRLPVHCPADKSGAACSYAMNPAISRASLTTMGPAVATTHLFYDANPDGSPATRHWGGYNVAFCDGQVHYLREAEGRALFGPSTPQ
jgi:prepilin-type processing-associated H-X9-DG protein